MYWGFSIQKIRVIPTIIMFTSKSLSVKKSPAITYIFGGISVLGFLTSTKYICAIQLVM